VIISVRKTFKEFYTAYIDHALYLRRYAPPSFVTFVSAVGISQKDALGLLP